MRRMRSSKSVMPAERNKNRATSANREQQHRPDRADHRADQRQQQRVLAAEVLRYRQEERAQRLHDQREDQREHQPPRAGDRRDEAGLDAYPLERLRFRMRDAADELEVAVAEAEGREAHGRYDEHD